MRTRIETDELGERELPLEAYYGIHSLRGKENFQITKQAISRQMIKSLALIKKAASKANLDAKMISSNVSNAIGLACDEIINGRLSGQFITDVIQGGGGTSINMNANEVIANRANEMLGGTKGKYEYVDPLTDVNCNQSSNDVIPTCGKITCIRMTKKLIVELKKFQAALNEKAKQWDNVLKIGRTHLNHSLPITLGKEFDAYASLIGSDLEQLDRVINTFYEINMGATLLGTATNAHPKYIKKFIFHLNKLTGEEYKTAKNLLSATSSPECFLNLSSALKVLATHLSKIASDLIMMSSDSINEIILPHVQSGSTMAPTKNHPVIPEMVNQVSFFVFGTDTTITHALNAGQFEYNPYLPIILSSLFEALTLIRRSIRTFKEKCLDDLTYNQQGCQPIEVDDYLRYLLLVPYLGHQKLIQIIKKASLTNQNFLDIIVKEQYLTTQQIEQILELSDKVNPGFTNEEWVVSVNNKIKTKEK